MNMRHFVTHASVSIIACMAFITPLARAQETPSPESTVPCPAYGNETGTIIVQPESQPESSTPMIVLNEIFPDPDGSDDAEFVELLNQGTVDADLAGWSITDAVGKTFVIDDVRIAAGAPRNFLRAETRIALNNDGESLRLINPSGIVVDEVAFNAHGHAGSTYARGGDGVWAWSLRATPGQTNVIETPLPQSQPPVESNESNIPSVEQNNQAIITSPIPPETSVIDNEPGIEMPSIKPIKIVTKTTPKTPEPVEVSDALTDDGLTEFTGTITVQPGRISKATFLLLEEAGRGFVVRLYGKDGPRLVFGDRISLRGRLHEDDDRPWISARKKDIVAIGTSETVHYEKRDIGNLSSDDLGLPVEITGLVISRGEHWLKVSGADGQGEIKATLPSEASVGPLEDGTAVSLKGIVHFSSQGLELVLHSKKQVTVVKTDVPELEKGAAAPEYVHESATETIDREPLVLGSVEQKDGRPLYAGLGLLAVGIISVLYWLKKRMSAA